MVEKGEEDMKILLMLLMLSAATAAHGHVGEPLESIPIQDAGRIKPFDTFARESLRLIHGRTTY